MYTHSKDLEAHCSAKILYTNVTTF
uniref:Uncharacterized protein n=1 Tax=Arundo donax TaxID=35708 RepID=A0A0A9FJT4_ARUDO